ncbi:Sortilin-related receptor [Chionoecetes opilio]|uniref:Sortilin-related receptor n=1 Tax=Chionoecetes opilio TaxID=41210 RepID=A0A8J4XQC0_CHIOP|nr:Sortilin-related receptor [Chionoecetes opilio]
MGLVLAADENERGGCSYNEFRCDNGHCIPLYYVCDGDKDCNYGEDERYCSTIIDYPTSSSSECPEYTCNYGTCIPDQWVCDGAKDCPYGDDEWYCSSPDYSTVTSHKTTYLPSYTTSPPWYKCDAAFDFIYDRCVFVDPFTLTSWDEARYLCQKFNGDLVVIDDFMFYSRLLHYIHSRGLDTKNYWVGATDQQEGVWRWVDSTPVHVGAPLWALYGCTNDYHLEPRPSDAAVQDCGYLDVTRGLYMTDASCDKEFAAICQGHAFGKETHKGETNTEEVVAVKKMKNDADGEVGEDMKKEK